MIVRGWFSLFVVLAGVFSLPAQGPNLAGKMPGPLPSNPFQPVALSALAREAPLFYVFLKGPTGMKATFFQGTLQGETVETPCVLGFRPGYLYRFALWNLEEFPNRVFFPSLEVRGSVMLAPAMKAAEYPAGLVLTDAHFQRAEDHGTMLRKVITLERPDLAVPVATSPESPLEITVQGPQDALWEAQTRGLPLALFHLGGKAFSAEELNQLNVPGTILLPGQSKLGPPQAPPCFPVACVPLADPVAGVYSQKDHFRIPDGGDVGLPAGFNRQGKLRGLDPSDTLAEYDDALGRKKIAVSNRVYLCIPRYIIVQNETLLNREIGSLSTASATQARGRLAVQQRQPVYYRTLNMHLELTQLGLKPSGMEMIQGTAVTGRIENLVVKAAVLNPQRIDQAKACPQPEAPDRPLVIIKWPDKCGATVGEIVTFFIQAANQGPKPVTNVAILDNLTNRFEYVPGSSKSDHEVTFTTQPNEVGSMILRWELAGELKPGESALVAFQVKVR